MSQAEFEYLGPYAIRSTLGRGGMGTVYKGVHSKSGEAVAIKVLATGVASQPRFRRRFAAEVETLKRLKHPNIVTLVGYGEEQGLLFYSMEYVAGHSLHAHLRQYQKLPWDEVVEVGVQTASALKHAHDLGIIHRDLKPANLMLNEEGQIKLTDFGIAKLFGSSDMTAAGSVIGTADYMPPEQAEGKPVTARSDLYSLGGVLYALLCGKAPFSGKSVPEVLYSVRYSPVPNLDELVPDAPTELCELIHELLDKNPQQRPPTALVVGNRLKSLQQGMNTTTSIGSHTPDPAPTTPAKDQIGTQLTSLDLSDVDEDELKLTGEDLDKLQESESHAAETPNGQGAPGTHELRTMLASDSLLSAKSAGEDQTSLANDVNEKHDSEFSHADSAESLHSQPDEEPITSGGPSHYTPIEENDTEQFSFSTSPEQTPKGHDWVQYASIAGIVALLVASVGLGWWMLRPDGANKIYNRVILAVESGDDGRLVAARSDIDEFLARFPEDERRAELETVSDDLELARWTRILTRRASREGGRHKLSVVEQGFLDCMQARSEDIEVAETKLSAFLKVFGPLDNLPSNEQRLVELAQFALTLGGRVERETSIAASQLEELIRSAEESLGEEVLQQYYRDLILLFGEKPWAEEQINRIRKELESES